MKNILLYSFLFFFSLQAMEPDDKNFFPPSLKALAAKKCAQDFEKLQPLKGNIPQDCIDLIELYHEPLTTKSMFELFKKAEILNSEEKMIECAEFIKHNAVHELTPPFITHPFTVWRLQGNVQKKLNAIEKLQEYGINSFEISDSVLENATTDLRQLYFVIVWVGALLSTHILILSKAIGS